MITASGRSFRMIFFHHFGLVFVKPVFSKFSSELVFSCCESDPEGIFFKRKFFCTDRADYKTVLEEIDGFRRNLSASASRSPVLRYQSGRRDTFAGNLSTEKRRQFFSHTDSQVKVPCGFFKEFPVPEAGEFVVDLIKDGDFCRVHVHNLGVRVAAAS